MNNTGAYWQILSLSGTNIVNFFGDGITAGTTHRIFCTTDGSIDITALGGGTVIWSAATAGQFMDVAVRQTTVNSGAFIGFKSKHNPHQFGPTSKPV
jgi:hypothetical protein